MTIDPIKQIDQAVYDNAAEALKIAKICMMMQKDTAFYTAILFSLKQAITEEVPTAATDGKHLLINPAFFWDMPINERITLLAHEVLHVGLDHMHRIGKRDALVTSDRGQVMSLWNIAADYVINYLLVKAGYKLPAGGLYDAQYAGMSTEQVYDLLYKKADKEQQKMAAQVGAMGNDIIHPDPNTPGGGVTQEEVTEIILRATTQAKSMGGAVPGEVGIHLQKTLNPPLPWNLILNNYLTEFAKDDYSFRRPNRRYLPDFYLPSAHSEAICNLAVCVDTSSSVSDDQFNDFITKIYEMQKMLQPQKISVMAFNTRFVSEQELKAGDDPFKKLVFKGKGGTRIAPVHEWLAKVKPTVALIFTDGGFQHEAPVNPRIPLIWLIYDNPNWTSPYGRVINYDIPA